MVSTVEEHQINLVPVGVFILPKIIHFIKNLLELARWPYNLQPNKVFLAVVSF